MPSIVIPKEFFEKERDNMYADPPLAWWREMFQNATDTGATRIAITMAETDDGLLNIGFADNGPGMTKDILTNVFFRLGATTKGGRNGVGGFGRARVLTVFSMVNYRIHTHYCRVIGDGAEYDIEDVETFTPGCRFDVTTKWSLDRMKDRLTRYLVQSNIKSAITLNGEPIRHTVHPGRHVRDLVVDGKSFASVWVNKSGTLMNSVVVRVRGAAMYAVHTNANAQVIVEIDPEQSREILTMNRDGLHYQYQNVLQNFLAELAADTSAALRPRRKNRTTVAQTGRGMIATKPEDILGAPRAKAKPVPQQDTVRLFAGPERGTLVQVPVGLDIGQDHDDGGDDTVFRREPRVASSGDHSFNVKRPHLSTRDPMRYLPDIYLLDETTDETPAAVRRAVARFDPLTWTVSSTSDVRKGMTMMKVMMAWFVACEHAVAALIRSKAWSSDRPLSWTVGWYFGEMTTTAANQTLGNGHVLALLPVDDKGHLAYSLSSRADLKRMMALAKHEVAHMVRQWHDEVYAGVLTDIDEFYDEKAVFRDIKERVALLEA